MDTAAKVGVSPENGVFIIAENLGEQVCEKWILHVVEQ
jgi:hypothetical protein